MYYITAFFQSIYNIDWLRAQKKQVGKAFAYVVLLSLLFAGIGAFVVLYRLPDVFTKVENFVQEDIPDFSATISNGELSVTQLEQPYRYEIDGQEPALIFVDTISTTTYNVAELSEGYNDALVITKDTFSYHENGIKTETIHFRDLNGLALSKQDITTWLDRLPEFLPESIIFVVSFLGIFLWFGIGKILYAIFLSLLVFIFVRLAKYHWQYEEILAVGLFAHTLPTLVQQLAITVTPHIPLLYTAIWGVVVGFTIWDSKTEADHGKGI